MPPRHLLLALLVAPFAPPSAPAQIPPDALVVLGFEHDGRPARSELIQGARAIPLASARSETAQINAACVDPLTGELVVSGVLTESGGSQGSLFAWTLDANGIAAERTLATSHPSDAVRAIVVDGDGNWVTAGPAGVFARRRADGLVVTRFDGGAAREWNALVRSPAEGLLIAATFGVSTGGELWAFDERSQRATFLARASDAGLPAALTGLWCEPVANGRVFVTTLDERAPLLVLDRTAGTLTPWPNAPPTGLNAIAGHGVDALHLLGAGNPSSDVYRLDATSGALSTVRSSPVAWGSACLVQPPAPGTLSAYPDVVFLQDPLDLHLVTHALAAAPCGLFLTAFHLQGATYQPLSPFFTGATGPDGAVRLHLQAPTSLYGDLGSGDWMEFQGVYADLVAGRLRLTNVERITAR